jgi:hypothetical protein
MDQAIVLIDGLNENTSEQVSHRNPFLQSGFADCQESKLYHRMQVRCRQSACPVVLCTESARRGLELILSSGIANPLQSVAHIVRFVAPQTRGFHHAQVVSAFSPNGRYQAVCYPLLRQAMPTSFGVWTSAEKLASFLTSISIR